MHEMYYIEVYGGMVLGIFKSHALAVETRDILLPSAMVKSYDPYDPPTKVVAFLLPQWCGSVAWYR